MTSVAALIHDFSKKLGYKYESFFNKLCLVFDASITSDVVMNDLFFEIWSDTKVFERNI